MNNELETLIGLEIHMELLTETKMYCSCKNTFGKMENTVVCPICSGYPGSLPNINQKAAELAVRAGLARVIRYRSFICLSAKTVILK